MNFETIKMEIASNPQYVSVIRLTTSGIANKIGFCLEDIEDIKVEVIEAFVGHKGKLILRLITNISSIIFCGTSFSRAISGHIDAAWQTSSIIRAAFLM